LKIVLHTAIGSCCTYLLVPHCIFICGRRWTILHTKWKKLFKI